MIFIEFIEIDRYKKHHFVGKDANSIFADTKGGTEFSSIKFTSLRVISEETARSLNLGYLALGMEAVRGGCGSYKLQTPSIELKDGESLRFCLCQAGGYYLKVNDNGLIFNEHDSRGDWGDDVILSKQDEGLVSRTISNLLWEKKHEENEIREKKDSIERTKKRLEKINAFLLKLKSL